MEQEVVSNTDVTINFFSGIEPSVSTLEGLIQENRLVITAVTVFELPAGVTRRRRHNKIQKFVSNIACLPLEREDAKIAAQIFFTRNLRHFSRIRGLKILKGD